MMGFCAVIAVIGTSIIGCGACKLSCKLSFSCQVAVLLSPLPSSLPSLPWLCLGAVLFLLSTKKRTAHLTREVLYRGQFLHCACTMQPTTDRAPISPPSKDHQKPYPSVPNENSKTGTHHLQQQFLRSPKMTSRIYTKERHGIKKDDGALLDANARCTYWRTCALSQQGAPV